VAYIVIAVVALARSGALRGLSLGSAVLVGTSWPTLGSAALSGSSSGSRGDWGTTMAVVVTLESGIRVVGGVVEAVKTIGGLRTAGRASTSSATSWLVRARIFGTAGHDGLILSAFWLASQCTILQGPFNLTV